MQWQMTHCKISKEMSSYNWLTVFCVLYSRLEADLPLRLIDWDSWESVHHIQLSNSSLKKAKNIWPKNKLTALLGWSCSKTSLTGESWFLISISWGLNPGPSWREAKGWPTGPVRLTVNVVRLQALHRAPPQQPTMSAVKPEGGPAASVKPGQMSYVRSCGIIRFSGQWPSEGLERSPPWSITSGSPM